jgi:hypothetical protein
MTRSESIKESRFRTGSAALGATGVSVSVLRGDPRLAPDRSGTPIVQLSGIGKEISSL